MLLEFYEVILTTMNSKIIDVTGAELQKLRVNMRKLQAQNWELAKSNSQLLAVSFLQYYQFLSLCPAYIVLL